MCTSFTVYSECDVNQCQNEGSCRKLGVSYICECAEGFSGLLYQTGKLYIRTVCYKCKFTVDLIFIHIYLCAMYVHA